MSIKYKVVSEWAAPTYYEVGTNEVLYDECNASEQALWVVSYDTENKEIIEWLQRFYIGEEHEAEEVAKELNEEGE